MDYLLDTNATLLTMDKDFEHLKDVYLELENVG